MNYNEGKLHLLKLTQELIISGKTTASFSVDNLLITYPGKKKLGDYRLSINGAAPKHSDVVKEIYELTTETNYSEIVDHLENIYTKGLYVTADFHISVSKIYWITLQEEINYPQPQYSGRKLCFQRFLEGAVAKVFPDVITLQEVLNRTQNHGCSRPALLAFKNSHVPSFYK